MRHFFSTLPHGIIDDNSLSSRILTAPPDICVDDFAWVFTPENTMIRTNHADVQPHSRNLFHQFENQRRIWKKYIRKIFLGMGHDVVIHAIVKFFKTCIMLAKSIAGKQNLFFIQIGKHAIGPVKHPGFHESQRVMAQTQGFTIFNGMIIKMLRIMQRQVFLPHF